jgi:hypothetical protein
MACARGSFTQTTTELATRSRLTRRLRHRLAQAIAGSNRVVAEVAGEYRGIHTVIIDPSAPYASGICAALPQARIAVDRWHLIWLAHQVVTEVASAWRGIRRPPRSTTRDHAGPQKQHPAQLAGVQRPRRGTLPRPARQSPAPRVGRVAGSFGTRSWRTRGSSTGTSRGRSGP